MRAVISVAALLASAVPVAAQTSALPPEVQAKLAEVGPVWGTNIGANVKKMEDTFTPLLAKAPKDGVTIVRDQAYGEDPKQRFDMYKPVKAERAPSSCSCMAALMCAATSA